MRSGKGNEMETGDIIKIHDGSYSLIYENGKLRDSSGVELECKGPYEVIATGCDLPGSSYFTEQRNNLIARSIPEGFILLIQERMCSLEHSCSVCPKCGAKL